MKIKHIKKSGFVLITLSLIICCMNFSNCVDGQEQSAVKPLSEMQDTNKIVGVWISEAKDSKMEILKSGDKYIGKLVAGWGNKLYEDDGKTLVKDSKNPDTLLRNRPLLNMVFITDLTFEDGKYKNGKLYIAKMGRKVSCKMEFKGDELMMRIYAGFPLFGTTKKWSKIN